MSLLTGGLHHLTIRTTDLARAKRFYVETLGFQPIRERDGALILNARGTLFRSPLEVQWDNGDVLSVQLAIPALATAAELLPVPTKK